MQSKTVPDVERFWLPTNDYIFKRLFGAPSARQRTLYYWARVYTEQLKKGQTYEDLRPCVAVWILGHDELHTGAFHSRFRLLETETDRPYCDALELHVIELPNLSHARPGAEDRDLVRWSRFVGARDERDLEAASMNDPELKEAWEEVRRLNADPATREIARAREDGLLMYGHSMAVAHSEGKAEGKAEAVVAVLEERGVPITDDERERILGCQDSELLQRWLRRAVTAERAAELFE
jgi:predicted transposase/invertase (TIGR01784 family)